MPSSSILRTPPPERGIAEEAVNEAMNDQFLSLPEDCLPGEEPARDGRYERRVLTTVREIAVIPRNRFTLFEESIWDASFNIIHAKK